MCRSPHTQILRLLGIDHKDAVIRRLNPVETLREQLTFRDGTPRYRDVNDRRTVILSPIVDPCPSIEFVEESLELISVIHELTFWDVRVLTKSALVKKLAERIPEENRHRVVYGVSLGILDDSIAKVVEKLTSPPSLRLEAYRALQEQDLRTYSMHCPVLPQQNYRKYAQQLAESMNWDKDERVWCEALNSRGESNHLTVAALQKAAMTMEAGSKERARLTEQADLLADVTRTRSVWEFEYQPAALRGDGRRMPARKTPLFGLSRCGRPGLLARSAEPRRCRAWRGRRPGGVLGFMHKTHSPISRPESMPLLTS